MGGRGNGGVGGLVVNAVSPPPKKPDPKALGSVEQQEGGGGGPEGAVGAVQAELCLGAQRWGLGGLRAWFCSLGAVCGTAPLPFCVLGAAFPSFSLFPLQSDRCRSVPWWRQPFLVPIPVLFLLFVRKLLCGFTGPQ